MKHDPAQIARGMARIRRSLEARLKGFETRPRGGARSGAALADYDWRGLWGRIAPRVENDGRGWRVVAREIGITSPDLSRIKAGQPVAVHKVLAVCCWANLDPFSFFIPAKRRRRRPGCLSSRRKVSRASAARKERLPCDGAPEKSGGVRSDADGAGGGCFTGKALKQRARKGAVSNVLTANGAAEKPAGALPSDNRGAGADPAGNRRGRGRP